MLEQKLDELVTAINALVTALNAKAAYAPAPVAAPMVAPAPAPVIPPVVAATPAVPAPAPVVAAAPTLATAFPSNAMPAPPTFSAPAPAPVAPGVPFSDQKGLVTYVMEAYRSMGPQKGAQIQQVLINMGCGNINEVKPEQYAALYAGVETIKAQ